MNRVADELAGDHSESETISRVIGLLKQLEDDQYREPQERFNVEELAEIADSAKTVIRILLRYRNA